jgi:hypothetical protein
MKMRPAYTKAASAVHNAGGVSARMSDTTAPSAKIAINDRLT